MSSMNTTTNLSSSSMKTLFIMFMKYAGAFVSTKDTTVNSNYPYLVTKAVFGMSLSNLHLMIARSEINLGEILGTLKLIKQTSILGRGYLFLMVTAFKFR